MAIEASRLIELGLVARLGTLNNSAATRCLRRATSVRPDALPKFTAGNQSKLRREPQLISQRSSREHHRFGNRSQANEPTRHGDVIIADNAGDTGRGSGVWSKPGSAFTCTTAPTFPDHIGRPSLLPFTQSRAKLRFGGCRAAETRKAPGRSSRNTYLKSSATGATPNQEHWPVTIAS